MSQESSPPSIPSGGSSPVHNNTSNNNHHHENDNPSTDNDVATATTTTPATVLTRSNRPSRACTIRTAARLYSALTTAGEQQRKSKVSKKDQLQQQQQQREEDESPHQCSGNSKIVTQLVGLPEPSQLPRWTLRSMWELASILNFLHIFRPLLNILVEFSAEEFETALITPNDTLSDIHIPLLKAIPPVTRMALTRDTWITVLCRKLRDWWDWVAEGDLPIVASHGVEIETYKTLDPWVRVVILKALCDIRVEQDDIRSYIDSSLKHGVQLSAFRNERIGGDSQGISYWYEDDPIIGHRLYREMRKTEVKRAKTKGSHVLSCTSYKWETVATNFDEFHDVSEKLSSSKNRTEASLGKKLKIDMLPEIEKVHKRKERLLKKQHRQALLLDNFVSVDGFGPGRSLRGRKPVTYTFDDFDRSINEAIKITKRNPEPLDKRGVLKSEVSANGKWSDSSNVSPHVSFSAMTPESLDYIDADDEHNPDQLDPSNHRQRQKPQRYSEREFVEAISDNEADFDSDDDIVGEAIYDEEYLKKRKQRKFSSSSEGDEEYRWDDENAEDEEDEEEEEEDSLGISEESDEPQKFKKLPSRTRRETKLRSVGELQSGLRRSRRATRNQINYRQYELSESETESMKLEKANASDKHLDAIENGEYSEGSQDFDGIDDDEEKIADLSVHDYPEAVEKEQNPSLEKSNIPGQDEILGRKRRFLDLNELAPVSGFDDGPSPSTIMKDDTDDI